MAKSKANGEPDRDRRGRISKFRKGNRPEAVEWPQISEQDAFHKPVKVLACEEFATETWAGGNPAALAVARVESKGLPDVP